MPSSTTVMVNVDDAGVAIANRLALLAELLQSNDEPRRRPFAARRLKGDARMKLIILDRDGTINEDRDDFVKSPDEWVPIPGVARSDRAAQPRGLEDGARDQPVGARRAGSSTWATLNAIHAQDERPARCTLGGRIDAVFFCPHRADRPLRLPQAAARPDEARSASASASTSAQVHGRRRFAARPGGGRRGRLPDARRAGPASRRGARRRGHREALLAAGARQRCVARRSRQPSPNDLVRAERRLQSRRQRRGSRFRVRAS